jgi:uncharacterized protein (DUF305 family)
MNSWNIRDPAKPMRKHAMVDVFQDVFRRRALRHAAPVLAALAALAALSCILPAVARQMHEHGHGRPTQADKPAGTAAAFAARMGEAMRTMNADMDRAPMTGDPDHDFAAMMIPHHQGAVEMAKAELLYGKNRVLRRLAQEIIVTQGSEISVMQSELNATREDAP